MNEGFPCVYYTISAWDPEGFEGACMLNDYKIDLIDRATPATTALGNQTGVPPSTQYKFKLREFGNALAPGEEYCTALE